MKESDPRSNDTAIVRATDLSVGYGGVAILEGLNFEIKRGEIFVILGGSGCGKSTLLKHLIGLIPPIHGEITVAGKSLADPDPKVRAEIWRSIGVAYQSGALFGSMTLAENIRLPIEESSKLPEDALRLMAWMKLKLVGLGDNEHSYPAEVSGGMQKRAALARAMALDPLAVFLDEPSAGLDPVTSAGLDALICRLNETMGMTFVIVTHELPSIFAIADRVIMLDKATKGIIDEGAPADLRDHSTHESVRQFFHREADPT